MNRSVCSKSSFAACLQANAKAILAVSAISIALLAGFYAEILYASTLMTSENGFEWTALATEANYVICLNDEGVACARNGVTGQIDYNSANILYVINNTENSGTAVIAAGRTSVSLEHELVSTPTHANLTPKDNLECRSYWYTANSTHITIHLSSPDASKDHSFVWSSETNSQVRGDTLARDHGHVFP